MTEDKYEHARANAAAWLDTIVTAYRAANGDRPAYDLLVAKGAAKGDRPAYDLLVAKGECNPEPDDDRLREAVEDAMHEAPLSVEVRSGWHDPSENNPEPVEYQILLTTGGPALRVTGDLNQHLEPGTVYLEMQDWGMPWREMAHDATAVLLWFAGLFYYGG